jgi:quercetin dioxygenase-like cupin family protein
MKFTLPYTIDSGQGEKIIFKEIIHEPDGEKVIADGFCAPKAGPPMHVHYKQDEGFKVIKGKMCYQIAGKQIQYLDEGQSVTFCRNTPHRFWNAGDEEMVISSWIKPANSIIFFLSTLYDARKKSGSHRPELFDAAYLTKRYKNEYALTELPPFVKKVIIPITYQIGVMLGKYKKFKDAPEPL